MKRALLDGEHAMFRDSFRTFLDREVAPFYAAWEQAGIVPREIWRKAGRQGFLGTDVPEDYGGAGLPDSQAAITTGGNPSAAQGSF